jgi:hypothetical protein
MSTDCTTLVPIASKLAKMIRLLGSDRDGEVLATVRAMRTVLANNGADLHLLADAIEAGPTYLDEALVRADQARRQAEEELRRAMDIARDMRTQAPPHLDKSWHNIAVECAGRTDLDERTREFVTDMVRWTINGGKPTEKQANWLRKIYARARVV